jgi:hypothetical protein
MYMEQATIESESEMEVTAVREATGPDKDDISSPNAFVKGVLIPSVLSIPIWICVLYILL